MKYYIQDTNEFLKKIANLAPLPDEPIKQLRGTAIGTKIAPPYAMIFMYSLEEDILSNSLLISLVQWRYIDDIFMVWEHGKEELKKFLETLNCYHPTIKFTTEYSRVKVNFPDVTVMKKSNQLVTDLYVYLYIYFIFTCKTD